jgi:hypothetical protein
MSLQNCQSPQKVLVFEPSANGVQTPKKDGHHATTDLLNEMGSPQSDAVESVSPHNGADFAKFVLHSFFLGLFVKIAGMPATFLLIELEFTTSSLIDHFFNWTETSEQVNDDGGSLIYRSFTGMFMFQHAYVTVEKKESGDFVVEYHTFNNPERFGDPLNGAFPKARFEFDYVDSERLVPLLPFCHPMTLKDASDASYNFARLNVYVDPEKNFLFFVFHSLSFSDEDEDEDREFEMKAIEFSFPIRSSGRSISNPIDFGLENGNYIASFTIKIGDEDYSIRFSFGTFESYSVDHRNGYYTLSAINHWTDSTTIFCRDTDAEELMEKTMSRLGIFSIEIPEFIAPETDDDSALVDALRPLPEDLQAFLRSITWCNPEARIAQFC